MFTDRELQSYRPRDKDYIVREATRQRGTGRLLFKVRRNGRREFYFQYILDGRQRRVKIGDYPAISLAAAREKAADLAALYQGGIDVKAVLEQQRLAEQQAALEEQRRLDAEARAGRFDQLLDAYVAYLRANERTSARRVEWSFDKYVKRAHPALIAKRARDISVADVRDILAAMVQAGITTTVNRLRGQLHAAFIFGLKQDYNPRNYLDTAVQFGLEHNPVAGIPVQTDWERVGERALSVEELRAFWLSLPGAMNPVIAEFLRFLFAIGGQRPQQVLRCTSDCYDIEQGLLNIANRKTRDKKPVPHLVPLNRTALTILERLKPLNRRCVYPFPGRGFDRKQAITREAVGRALQAHLVKQGLAAFQLRDIRRTWKTLAGEAGITKDLRDRVQGHALHDVSSKHYDRYEYLAEKRQALEQWDRYLRRIIGPRLRAVR